ncbi:hypothetical protein QZH41_005518 [Actinostola sp. cb2023]|nr:hypothetical protein QZH41_005518 [Actinostola sp. cb2023]
MVDAGNFPKLCLRVLEAKNKRKFKSYSLSSLPYFGNVMEFKEFLMQNNSDETGAKDTMFELGYYGKPRNERFVITNEVQFAEALSLEQKGWLTLWLCVPESTGISDKGKRQHSAESKPLSSKKSKVESDDTDDVLDKLEKQFHILKEKHPHLPGFKLRVWAKMLVNGTLDDEDEVPRFPFFSGKKGGPPQNPSSSTTSSTITIAECDSLSAKDKKMRLRESIIKQLKEIKELKDAAILSDVEFNAQRDKLVKELSEA